MKTHKMISLLLAAALVLVTAACSSGSVTPATTTAAQTTEAPATETQKAPVIDLMPFLKDGEIYVELNLDKSVKNAAVSLDGTKLSGTTVPYKQGMTFELSGDFAEDAGINVIIVFSNGANGSEEADVQFKNGVDVDKVSEIVTRSLSHTNAQKVFISLYEKDGSWDKSLSSAMNDFITKMYPPLR